MNELENILAHESYKVLLIGDNGRDHYFYGSSTRMSEEAPIPVFDLSYDRAVPGMAANTLENLLAFGLDVTYIHSETSVKERYVETSTNRQMFRVDKDIRCTPVSIPEDLSIYDCIVISDYCKGSVSYEQIEQVRQTYSGPIFLDTKKKDLARFENIFVKVNEHEYKRRTSDCSSTLVTLGSRGCLYNETVYPAEEVSLVDVTGAGDTFVSALCYRYLKTNNIEQSIKYANKAAAVVIERAGTYALKTTDVVRILP